MQLGKLPELKSMLQTPSTIAPALEGPVDPDKYFVGPSDVFSVNIWLSLPINFSVTVTPEGTLIVPTVGEIRVADCTLREAKKRVLEEIKKRNKRIEDEGGTKVHQHRWLTLDTGIPAFANTMALPPPMVPAPTTPTLVTGIVAVSFGISGTLTSSLSARKA